jgi:CxxC-x17-CxxC domain-containing protein
MRRVSLTERQISGIFVIHSMYKSKRDNFSGGNGKKKFGGSAPWKQDRRGDSFEKTSFDAVCADCGEACTVPFRPNGRKPVLCSRCFKRDGGGSSDFGGKSYDKPSYGSKPSYNAKPAYGGARSSSSSHELEEQLKTVNRKLDAILEALGSKKH